MLVPGVQVRNFSPAPAALAWNFDTIIDEVVHTPLGVTRIELRDEARTPASEPGFGLHFEVRAGSRLVSGDSRVGAK